MYYKLEIGEKVIIKIDVLNNINNINGSNNDLIRKFLGLIQEEEIAEIKKLNNEYDIGGKQIKELVLNFDDLTGFTLLDAEK